MAAVCRRMFGEMQEKRVVTETTVTIVTTFGQTRYHYSVDAVTDLS